MPALPKRAANPVVPALPVVQVDVPVLGVAGTIGAVLGSGRTTPLAMPALSVVRVDVPLLSGLRPFDGGVDTKSYDQPAASPSYMDARVWVRGKTRTRQRVIPLRCMGAVPDTHVPRDIYLAGVTGLRSRGWGACYALGVGCRLYHAGSPRGPAYESHPWRKGWPLVSYDGVGYNNGCIQETVVPQVGFAFDSDPILSTEPMFVAMLGHACTLLRL